MEKKSKNEKINVENYLQVGGYQPVNIISPVKAPKGGTGQSNQLCLSERKKHDFEKDC